MKCELRNPPDRSSAEIADEIAKIEAQFVTVPDFRCAFCERDFKPVKLRRRWVHHVPRFGRLFYCKVTNLNQSR